MPVSLGSVSLPRSPSPRDCSTIEPGFTGQGGPGRTRTDAEQGSAGQSRPTQDQGSARRNPRGPRGGFLGPPAGGERAVASWVNLQPPLVVLRVVLVWCWSRGAAGLSFPGAHPICPCAVRLLLPLSISLLICFPNPIALFHLVSLVSVNTARAAGPRLPRFRLFGFALINLLDGTSAHSPRTRSSPSSRHAWRNISHSEQPRLDLSQVPRRSFFDETPQ